MEVVKPWVESKITNSWVDPFKAESDEKLLYQYKLAWAWAKAAQEFLDYLNRSVEEAEALTKKEKGEVTDKLRTSLS